MIGKVSIGLGIVGILTALASGGAVFIGSGVYNIGADDHHTKVVSAVIQQLRDRSIEARTRRLEVHSVYDPARITAGAQRYSTLCVTCHLAPGVTKSDLRSGLSPHPPNLAQEKIQAEDRTFWITVTKTVGVFGMRLSAHAAKLTRGAGRFRRWLGCVGAKG